MALDFAAKRDVQEVILPGPTTAVSVSPGTSWAPGVFTAAVGGNTVDQDYIIVGWSVYDLFLTTSGSANAEYVFEYGYSVGGAAPLQIMGRFAQGGGFSENPAGANQKFAMKSQFIPIAPFRLPRGAQIRMRASTSLAAAGIFLAAAAVCYPASLWPLIEDMPGVEQFLAANLGQAFPFTWPDPNTTNPATGTLNVTLGTSTIPGAPTTFLTASYPTLITYAVTSGIVSGSSMNLEIGTNNGRSEVYRSIIFIGCGAGPRVGQCGNMALARPLLIYPGENVVVRGRGSGSLSTATIDLMLGGIEIRRNRWPGSQQ